MNVLPPEFEASKHSTFSRRTRRSTGGRSCMNKGEGVVPGSDEDVADFRGSWRARAPRDQAEEYELVTSAP